MVGLGLWNGGAVVVGWGPAKGSQEAAEGACGYEAGGEFRGKT